MTATDFDQMQHLDFDHQLSCEVPRCAGERGPASHRLTSVRCHCVVPVCQACLAVLLQHVADWLDEAVCLSCYSVLGPAYLGDLFRAEPLP